MFDIKNNLFAFEQSQKEEQTFLAHVKQLPTRS